MRGAAAPGFSLPRLVASTSAELGNAAPLRLADLQGRIVLVNFWATWCEPCEREMPAMERLYALLSREDFELVAVAIDEQVDEVRAFQDRYRLSFPIVLDSDQSIYRAYQTMGVPESLLIDRSGRIIERYVGPREWDDPAYVERIRSLFAGHGESGMAAGRDGTPSQGATGS